MSRSTPLKGLPRQLQLALARPEPWTPHDAPFWDDPYIARQMLAAHLDPTTDAASYRPATIQRIVENLWREIGLAPGDRLVDLGCGPGLYVQQFAARGLEVLGIDLSRGSIAHARRAAREAGLRASFQVDDYTTAALGTGWDAAVLISRDFGVLPDEPRDRLLDSLHTALKPGCAFAFDVRRADRGRIGDGAVVVAPHGPGFWRPRPHLEIQTTYRYGDDLDLTQHAIVEADGSITTYRVWDRGYTVAGIRALLARHGFAVQAAWSNLAGSPLDRSSEVIALLAVKR